MSDSRRPHEIVTGMIAELQIRSDSEVLSALTALAPLADEDHACWEDDSYWMSHAYPYLACAAVTGMRKLRPAVRLLLDRACFGDPGEIMRSLHRNLEAIFDPDWEELADECLAAAISKRRGTRLWALDALAMLDEPRARAFFEEAVGDESDWFRSAGALGLDRLARAGHS